VLIRDGSTLVLGGLIQDSVTNTENSVPILGSIPLIGELFRTRNTEKTKTNFLIFLQPHILRNDEQAAQETDAKYNYIRDQQKILNHDSRKIPFQPFAPADPLPAMNDGRVKTGILSPDVKDPSTPYVPSDDSTPTTPAPAPTPYTPASVTAPAPAEPTENAPPAGAAR